MTAGRTAAVLFTLAALASPVRAAGPNLLLVTVDTLRADRLGCYGFERAGTRAIDGLAASGSLFVRAYAHTPTTLPSHTNILLGRTPPYHGVSENSKARVGAAFLTLAEHLKAAGFETAAFVGAFPLDSRFGLDQGFDLYDDVFPAKPAVAGFAPERTADEVVKSALAWLRGRPGPWFCWVHLWDPHAPYEPPEPYRSAFASDPYAGETAFVDAQLGVLFETLRASGQLAGTVMVLTADHGESLGEHGELTHGYFAYDSTLRVPLIVAGPGVRKGRIETPVSHIDIFPTVCALLRVGAPPGLPGRSLLDLKDGGGRRPIYFESLQPSLNSGCAPLRGFIAEGVKYIDSPLPEVYDLARDGGELTNLAGQADVASLKKKLEALLSRQAGPGAGSGQAVADPKTREALKSLGYIVSPVPASKPVYGVQDDLKSFLPYQQQLERAVLLGDAGRDDESGREFEALLRAKEHFVPAYIHYSQLQMMRGRVAEALRILEEGIRINPGDYPLLTEYGRALIRAGRFSDAVGVLERAVAGIDFDPDSWADLGRARVRAGAPGPALEAFERALVLDPSSAPVHAEVGALRLNRYRGGSGNSEDLDLAIRAFETAAALDPSLNAAFRGLGYASLIAGRPAQAMKAWARAVAIQPDDDFSSFNLGLLYLEAGDKTAAKRLFSALLERGGASLPPGDRERLTALIERCK